MPTARPDSALDDGLANRYGRAPGAQHRRRRWIIVASAAFVGLFALWLILINNVGASGDINATDTAYSIIDDHHVNVSFDVTSAKVEPIACALQALNKSFAVVGWKVVEIPASKERTRSFTETVRTTQKSTTGLISRCWLT